jgi:ParB family chromosome partitioning protein
MNIQEISISKIDTAKYRLHEADDEKQGGRLRSSINQVGLLQPVIVQSGKDDKYVLIAGHRRIAALKDDGQQKVHAVIFKANESAAVKMALTENLIRRPLNTLETIKGLKMLKDQGMKQKEIGTLFGWTDGQVSNMLAITEFHKKAQLEVNDALEKGEIKYGHAKALLALKGYPEEQNRVLVQLLKLSPKERTVRMAEQKVREAVAKIKKEKLPVFNFNLPEKVIIESRAKSARLVICFDSRKALESVLNQFISENSFHVKSSQRKETTHPTKKQDLGNKALRQR